MNILKENVTILVVTNIYYKKKTMSDLKKLIRANIENLFTEEKYFDEMESAFGVDKKLSVKEKAQFDDMEEVGIEKNGPLMKNTKENGEMEVEKASKVSGKDAVDYYKETAKKMKKFQTPDEKEQKPSQIGEGLTDAPKVDREEASDDVDAYEVEALGAGKMSGLKYDDEDSEQYKAFEDRNDAEMEGDPTYKKIKDNGKKYKDYKYNKPEEYHNSPKVRVKENKIKMEYTDVMEENIFKANGKLISEEQVLKIANKVPSRVKVDESVFAITDGENYYRLMWEGDEPIITHSKNTEIVKESISKMKAMWEFNPNDSISTKKTITESADDAFKRMFKQLKESETNEPEELIREFDEQTFMKTFNTTVGSYRKLSGSEASEEEKQKLFNQAKEDNFNGNLKVGKKGDGYYLYYHSSNMEDPKTSNLPWYKKVGGRGMSSL